VQVVRLKIQNFRGVRDARMYFDGHTLLVGPNNVGKSTICEALELVLGPERLRRRPPLDEFDFYNSRYLEKGEEGEPKAIPLRIEVVLIGLTDEIASRCASHVEFWDHEASDTLGEGALDAVDRDTVEKCLRLETVGRYDPEEDEFEAETYFSHSPDEVSGRPRRVTVSVKRLIGFLYLRTIRTGSRALSLERGSLLDVVLRAAGVRTKLWEQTISRLRDLDPPIEDEAAELVKVLAAIEERLGQYVQIEPGSATKLYVSQLTREHLRKTVSFFLRMSKDQAPVPFHEVGSGTLNTLVLALLSFIADMKEDNVIFAMEEPEIALPPHTQRRVADYLLGETTQCFVTSHSPYIIERFELSQVRVLRRPSAGQLNADEVSLAGLKSKAYRKYARRISETMLGRGVIVAEGITEVTALYALAEKLEAASKNRYALDLAGVTVFTSDGDGSLADFGNFFKALDLKTYALYDKKKRTQTEEADLQAAFDHPLEIPHKGAEELLVAEVPVDRQWELLEQVREAGTHPKVMVPTTRPSEDDKIKSHCVELLKAGKGEGLAGQLISLCDVNELPATYVGFLEQVYSDFPRPKRPAPLPLESEEDSETSDSESTEAKDTGASGGEGEATVGGTDKGE